MIINILKSLLLFPFTLSMLAAQTSQEQKLQRFKSEELAISSDNAALLMQMKMPNTGNTQLNYFRDSGKFKHRYDGVTNTGFQFQSERYQELKKWHFYGGFEFKSSTQTEVANTSLADPFRDNPYQFADSLQGDWKKQDYRLSLKVAAPKLMDNKLTLGLGLNYHILTGARQRDPRPLDNANQIDLSPSFVYELSDQQYIAGNFNYQYYRSDQTIEMVNYLKNYKIYKLTGLGEYQRSAAFEVSSGLARVYDGAGLGGAIQYGIKGNQWQIFAEAGYLHYREDVLDGSAVLQEFGTHRAKQLKANLTADWFNNATFHKIQLAWNQKDMENTENHILFDSEANQYNTLYASVFNTMLKTRGSLAYQLNKMNAQHLTWSLLTTVGYTGLDNRYSSTMSKQIIDKMDFSVDFTKYYPLRSGSDLSVQIVSSYDLAVSDQLDYSEKDYSTNFVAQQILFPIHDYLGASSWNNQLALQYTLKSYHKKGNRFYVKASGYLDTAMEQTLYFEKGDHRFGFQAGIGLYH